MGLDIVRGDAFPGWPCHRIGMGHRRIDDRRILAGRCARARRRSLPMWFRYRNFPRLRRLAFRRSDRARRLAHDVSDRGVAGAADSVDPLRKFRNHHCGSGRTNSGARAAKRRQAGGAASAQDRALTALHAGRIVRRAGNPAAHHHRIADRNGPRRWDFGRSRVGCRPMPVRSPPRRVSLRRNGRAIPA